MTYMGYIRNGTVVLEQPVAWPDGSKVECILVQSAPPRKPEDHLFDDLMEFAGKASGYPEDGSENVDHYLYGHPRV